MPYPYKPAAGGVFVTVPIADVSTVSQVYVVPGFSGRLKKIWSVINGAITVADAVLTAKINGVAVTNGVVTIANSGSAAGVVDSATPSALNTFASGDAIEIEHGGSTGAVGVVVTLELE